MTDFVQQVCEFNRIAGTKNEFDERKAALYIGLCLEELAEVIESLNDRKAFRIMTDSLDLWSKRFKEGDFDADVAKMDRVECLDGFIDLAVVSLGGAYAIGADVQGAANEVSQSNLSKYDLKPDGTHAVIRDENGKVKKGPNYKPPELEKFL